MKLYQKLPFIIGITLTTMLGLFYAASSTVLWKNLERAEEQTTIQAIKGVQNVLAQTEEDFSNRFADWSSWDDAYAFVQHPRKEFIESNLVPQALANLRVHLVMIVKPSGQIVYGTGFDSVRNVKTTIPEQMQHLSANDPLLQLPREGKNVLGLFMVDQKPMFITARPILTSEGKGPIQGIIIFGRCLDLAEIHRLNRVTRLHLDFYPLTTKLSDTAQHAYQNLLSDKQEISVQINHKQPALGFTILKNIYDQPALLLQVQLPHEVHKEGHSSFQYLTITLTIIGTLFGGLIVFLVHRLVGFVAQRQQMEAALEYETLHDYLTGLPNRKLFMMRLEQATHKSKQQKNYCFSVLFLDLDHFKLINDRLGHLAGDQVLIETAQRLLRCVRAIDTCARLSGDEFAILLESLDDENSLHQIVQRIQKELSQPLVIYDEQIHISASIGTILSGETHEKAEDFIQAADAAMYRAKAMGRGCYECCDQASDNPAINSLLTSIELKRAIKEQEFVLYYQPIFSLESTQIHSCEALLRWHHPTRGLISPDEFLPIAEESGLIISLGWWALQEACRQLAVWHSQFPVHTHLCMNVNLSAKQFSQPNLTDYLQQTLKETGVKANQLALELTERVIMDNLHKDRETIAQLQHLGVQIAIDDFGTGYSALTCLDCLPIQTIKIDRSFLNNSHETINKLEIITALMTLANNLGLQVAAKGIETAEQLATLKRLGCHYGQGYFFSKPLNTQMFTLLLESTCARR